jgi:hypothetical protein
MDLFHLSSLATYMNAQMQYVHVWDGYYGADIGGFTAAFRCTE